MGTQADQIFAPQSLVFTPLACDAGACVIWFCGGFFCFNFKLSIVVIYYLLDEPAAGKLVTVIYVDFEGDLGFSVHFYS
jgi:hypothetical protein